MADASLRGGVRWVLLVGGLRASPLVADAGVSTLDLSLAPDRTALERWLEVIAATADVAPVEGVWVVFGANTPRPSAPKANFGVRLEIIPDPRPLRGPAGIVRDVCADWPADTTVVAAEAKRCHIGGLSPMLRRHFESNAEVTVGANVDGSPAGVYVLRRSTLEYVSGAGFMDLKEQWLRRAQERKADVRVFRLAGRGAMPLRTREQFLSAAMALSGLSPEGRLARFSVFGADGATQDEPFVVLGPGATIGSGALVLDSIVMERAEVGPGSVVVRSILAPGARVQPGSEVVDAVVTARGVVSKAHERKGSENPAAKT